MSKKKQKKMIIFQILCFFVQFSIIIIDVNATKFNECKNNQSIGIIKHWKFHKSNKQQQHNNIQCLHDGEPHELCDNALIWPKYIDCDNNNNDLITTINSDNNIIIISNNIEMLNIKDTMQRWSCNSDSVMASYIILKCHDNTNTEINENTIDVCDVSIDVDCKVIFDPVIEYNTIVYSLIAIVLFVFFILMIMLLIFLFKMPNVLQKQQIRIQRRRQEHITEI